MKGKYIEKTQKFINKLALKNSSSYVLKKNNLLLSIYATIGVPAINIIDIALPQSVLGFILSEDYNLDFVYYLFFSSKKVFKKISETGSQPNISLKNIQNLIFKLPLPIEQQKIAKFFSLLDKQIELWETKLQLNELFKKFYLNNLYVSNKNNEYFPKFRFEDFEDEWEEKTIGDVLEIRTGNKDLQNKNDIGKYPFFVRSKTIEKIDKYALDKEAILIPGDGKIGDIFHYFNGKFNYHQRVYCLFNFTECAKFIFYEFKKNLKKHLKRFSAKATVDSIRLPMLKEYVLFLPSILEQQKIAKFFSLLDKLDEENEYIIMLLKKRKSFFINSLFE